MQEENLRSLANCPLPGSASPADALLQVGGYSSAGRGMHTHRLRTGPPGSGVRQKLWLRLCLSKSACIPRGELRTSMTGRQPVKPQSCLRVRRSESAYGLPHYPIKHKDKMSCLRGSQSRGAEKKRSALRR